MRLTSDRVAFKVGILGVAGATALSLAPAAHATTARPAAKAIAPHTAAVHALPGDATAKRASWHTFPGGHRIGKGKELYTKLEKRPRGVRIMQVKARCWGSSRQMSITLWYRNQWGRNKVAKRVKQRCNGRYGVARIHNAGHTWYWGQFSNKDAKTVESWFQYYG